MNSGRDARIFAGVAVVAVLGAAVILPWQVGEAAQQTRPNIVYILADDLGYSDVGFTGGTEVSTPNVDALAASGARLTQFYAQPVCTPTRGAMLTGRYPMRLGLQVAVVRPLSQFGLPLEERTLPQALKEVGYRTALVGKWHLGHYRPEYLPTRRGFDTQYGLYNGAADYFTRDRDGAHDWHRNDRAEYEEGYTTHLLTQEAVRVIRESDPNQPFFLDLAYSAPHQPLQVPEEYMEPYAHLPEARRAFAGMIAAMDEGVGQVMAALTEKGLLGNTLIIFSSDNGGIAPGVLADNSPYRAGKGTLYEGGVRVAAAASWRGHIRPGSVVDQPIHIVDWYPTFLRLAGASLRQPLPLDGVDVWATVADGRPSPRAEILFNSTPETGAIRIGDWKLIINPGAVDNEGGGGGARGRGGRGRVAAPGTQPADDAEQSAAQAGRIGRSGRVGGPQGGTDVGPARGIELYNLADDPGERNNLAETAPDKVRELRARYDALAAQAAPPKAYDPIPAGLATPKVWGE